MPSVIDFYKYASLTTAAYVRMGIGTLTGVRLADLAATQSEGRLPLSIGQYLFDPDNQYNAPVWTIAHYFGSDNVSDPNASQSKSGFAATLFRKSGENVLARQWRRNLSPCAFTT